MKSTHFTESTTSGAIATVATPVGKTQTRGKGIDPNEKAGNLLTGKKRMTYKADGTAVYKLAETSIGSVDSVYVLGVLQTLTTQYTVDLTAGTVTFTAGNIPVASIDEDEVEIYWTKGVGTRSSVVNNRFAFFNRFI